MTPYEIQQSVARFLEENWAVTPIREINKDVTASAPFIEFYSKPGLVRGLEINGVAERVGVFMINIFTKLGVGVQEGDVYGGLLESLFWHRQIDDIVCEIGDMMPYTSDIGVDPVRQMYHHQTVIPFSVITEY